MQNGPIKYGITGFWMAGQTPPPEVSKASVLAAVELVTRMTGWKLVGNSWSAESSNYHQFHIARKTKQLKLLFNAYYPLVAFSVPLQECRMDIEFVDCSDLADVFRRLTDFQPMSKVELTTPVKSTDLKDLNKAELEQFNYWKPKTVGELVFNFWD